MVRRLTYLLSAIGFFGALYIGIRCRLPDSEDPYSMAGNDRVDYVPKFDNQIHQDVVEYNEVVGIHIGDGESRVGCKINGTNEIIADSQGRTATPNYVAIIDGETLVGFEAKEQELRNPTGTIFGLRRLLGRAFSDPSFQEEVKQFPFEVVDNKGAAAVKIGKIFTPEEVMSKILSKLKNDAEIHLNKSISSAVISIPAYFNDAQREAVMEASRLAGMESLRLVKEPIATSIAHKVEDVWTHFDNSFFDMNIMVFNLDHSRVDVTILCYDIGIYEILAMADSTSRAGVRSFNSPWESTEQLFDMAVQIIKQALVEANITKSGVNEFIIAGQSGYVSTIQPLLQTYFEGKQALSVVNPSDAILHGVINQAAIFSSDDYVDWVPAFDITTLSLGIQTNGGIMEKWIPRHSIYPTWKSYNVTTVTHNQSKIVLRIYEGERPMVVNNRLLGTLELDGIALAPAGKTKIRVVFEIGPDHTLAVEAWDIVSGKTATLLLSNRLDPGMSQEIDNIHQDAEDNLEQDIIAKEKALAAFANDVDDPFGVVVSVGKHGRN